MKSPGVSLSAQLSVAFACLFFFVALTNAQSLPGHQAPTKSKPDEAPVATKAAQRQAPLANLYGHLRADTAKVKRLPPLKSVDRAKKSSKKKVLQVGVVRELPDPLNPLTDSAAYVVIEGEVRVAAIVSEGARRLRVQFKDFSLPPGARVFVYSASDPHFYLGPYEGRGPWGDGKFWTPSLPGDQVVIEYTAPPGTTSGAPFKIAEVSHIYKDLFSASAAADFCNLEVPAEWANVAKSVGLLDFVTEGQEALCTGTLLNDSDTAMDHHVLTANHCIDSQEEAQSVVVYWNYNTGDSPPGGTPTTVGANRLVTGVFADFTLLRLTGNLPGGLFFSGWDANPLSAGTSVTGIHHPQGSHKRISFGATNSDCHPQLPASCSNFTGVTWSQGTTEDGSSGSGLWTGTPDTAKLVGTLTGGDAACGNPSGSDFYGRFSLMYPSVAPFLEPHRTLTVASTNPTSGIGIIVTPNDLNNQGNGSTPFTRTYFHNTTVNLVANSGFGGVTFQKWQRDGQDFSTNTFVSVTMDSNHTMTAVYVSLPTYVLTVASSNPSSGVNITVTPNDRNGLGNGTTEFTRTYIQNTNVNLTAPASANGNTFWKWRVDGVDLTTSQSMTVTMGAAHTATAIYFTPVPTPTPTPVPGAGSQPIAFVKPGSAPNSGNDLFLANIDGTNLVNLTDTPGNDELPAWSPDGSRLAYTCMRQPDGSISLPRRICVRNADGTGFAVLSNTLADDYGPTWSRDGSQIAFTTANSSSSQTTLGIMNADGTGRFQLFFSGSSNPDWSPDNWTLVFQSFARIWTYNRLTQTGLALTNGTSDMRPRYSPDGSKIVFESFRDGRPQIYVMNSDGSSQTRLTNNTAYETAPVWSPDGTKILFTSLRDGHHALYVMNADGSNQTRVTAGSDGTWRSIPGAPVVFMEQGTTNNAAVVDSVTYVHGPFKLTNPNNFSSDQITRLVVFTSNLGLNQSNPDPSILSVKISGLDLVVENVRPFSGAALNGSQIVVALKRRDGGPMPTGNNLAFTLSRSGQISNAATITLVP